MAMVAMAASTAATTNEADTNPFLSSCRSVVVVFHPKYIPHACRSLTEIIREPFSTANVVWALGARKLARTVFLV